MTCTAITYGTAVTVETCGYRRGTAAGLKWHQRHQEPSCGDCATEAARTTPVLRADLSNWRFG